MAKKYSIAEARRNLTSIVHEVEHGSAVELTRHGDPVAVMMSLHEYRRLKESGKDFWDAYSQFRKTHDLKALRLDEALKNLRDQSQGRDIEI